MKKMTVPLVVGNWKMNPQTDSSAKRLATEVKKALARVDGVAVVMAPPFPFLSIVHGVLGGNKKIELGVQNIHAEKLGAYTGEVSLPMVESYSVTHVILGHSERRRLGETDDSINQKIHAVLKANMTPVVCVGESGRDHGAQYLNVVEGQVRSAVRGVSKNKLERVVIAYEPIWAIGTGLTATPEDVHEMRLFIEKVLSDLYGRALAHKVRVLYGGSVNAGNASVLMQNGEIDGFLVGGASLIAEEFVAIVKAASHI